MQIFSSSEHGEAALRATSNLPFCAFSFCNQTFGSGLERLSYAMTPVSPLRNHIPGSFLTLRFISSYHPFHLPIASSEGTSRNTHKPTPHTFSVQGGQTTIKRYRYSTTRSGTSRPLRSVVPPRAVRENSTCEALRHCPCGPSNLPSLNTGPEISIVETQDRLVSKSITCTKAVLAAFRKRVLEVPVMGNVM